MVHLVLMALIWHFFLAEICRPLGVPGQFAHLYSGLTALTLTLLNASLALGQFDLGRPVEPLDAAFTAFHFGLLRKPFAAAAGIALVLTAAIPASNRISLFDWNHMFQHILVLLVWAAVFSGCFSLTASVNAPGFSRARCITLAFAILGGLKALQASGVVTAEAEQRWASAGSSSQLAASLLVRRPAADGGFYEFLAENTNLSHSLHVRPASVDFVSNLASDVPGPNAGPGPGPNIFIITIDSLRRDYLSPYNPAIAFTPAIRSFADESTVFRNAFTHYGGTGLSEPSIWSGSLLLHKQYVTPFAPTNALEKLLRANHYRTHITRDSILSALLTASAEDDDLDAKDQNMSYDLGRSLAELEARLDRNPPHDKPVFAYTQPQNLHISVIQREGASVPAGETYSGFYAPYASRLRKIDQAFGHFISFLKARNLYDNSIVILTADHGDSLGEDGRWGHAYTIYPEIVRIPLIIHLPQRLQSRFTAEAGAVAFSTDITPSLYALLGYTPIHNENYGRPLFTSAAPPAVTANAVKYFIASSYGAVYAVLSNGDTRLYIANAIESSEQLFDLTAPTPRRVDLPRELSDENKLYLQARINAIRTAYGMSTSN